MRATIILLVLLFVFSFESNAQLGVGTISPDPSAQLDVVSTSRGFLPPRLTEVQRNAVVNPADGLMVFCSDCNGGQGYYVYYNNQWNALENVNTDNQSISRIGTTVSLTNGGTFQDSVLTEAQVDAFANNNGYLSSEVDGSVTNEIQSLSKSGQTVTLSNSGGSFTDSVLTEAQVDAFANNNGYLSSEVDGSTTNEIQNLNLSGNNLQIDGATGVDLTTFMDNTDNQSISRPAGSKTVTLSNGTGANTTFTDSTDNLGNHIANQSIQLNNNLLSNNGSEGINVSDNGDLSINRNAFIGSSGLENTTSNYLQFHTQGRDGLNVVRNSHFQLGAEGFGGVGHNKLIFNPIIDGTDLGQIMSLSSLGNLSIGSTASNPEKLYVQGAIRIDSGSYSGISQGATTPVPAGGEGTMVYYNNTFYGWNGSIWNALTNTDNQSIGRSGLTVTLQNGGTFQDSVLTEAEVDVFVNNNGYLSSEVDGSVTNEIQSISKSGQTVTLSNGGGNFKDDVLTEAEVDAYANNNGYLSSEVDGSVTNEIQNLSLSGNNLNIDGASGVDLSSFMDNTDNQSISRTGTTVSLTNGGTFQDSVLTEAEVDAFANNNGYLSSEVDGSITNEIQSISKSGQTVTLSNGGGNFTDDVLTEAEVDAFANNNGYLSSEVDGSVTNEIQDLSLNGSTLSLSNSSANIDLGSLKGLAVSGNNNYHGNNDNLTNLFPTLGAHNTALGNEALKTLTEGSLNTGLGAGALFSLDSGSYNSGLGRNTLQSLTKGSNNVAVGSSTGFHQISGDDNVFIGREAGPHPSSTSHLTKSSKLYINSGRGTPLIGGDFAAFKVGINYHPVNLDANSATLTVGGDIQLGQGVKIRAFSTGFSKFAHHNDVVPTETGIKNFVDAAILEADPSATNEIQTISRLAGSKTVTLSNGGGAFTDSTDNLGNHTATQNLVLNGNRLANINGGEGLRIDNLGNIFVNSNALPNSGDASTQSNFLNFPTQGRIGTTVRSSTFQIRAEHQGVYGVNKLAFWSTNDGINKGQHMALSSTGNLTIGSATTNPEKLYVQGAIRIDSGGYQNISHGANTPVPAGGAGTMVHYNNNFYGWNGTNWDKINGLVTEAEIDAYANNNGYLTSFTEADGSSTNEIQSIDVASFSNNTLNLSLSQEATTHQVDLSSLAGLVDAGSGNVHGGNGNLASFTSGFSNIALGSSALNALTTGNLNTAVGASALAQLSNGSDNLGLGRNTMNNLTIGTKNTAVGASAGFSISNGSRNVFIGHTAGPTSSSSLQSDKLYINVGATNNPLIGGDFALNKVGINYGILSLSASSATLTVGGDIQAQYGAKVNEFSIDGTLAGNSDIAVPTEKAVKTYVDSYNFTGSAQVGTWPAANVYAMFGHSSLDHSYATVNGSEYALIQANNGATFLNSHANSLYLRVDNKDYLTILQNGNIGIGNTNPTKAKLEISGSASYTTTTNSIYLHNNSAAVSGVHGPGLGFSFSMYASDAIAGSFLVAHSDERIKSIIGASNSEADLNTLMKIEIIDYQFKDTVSKGQMLQKKVIAQQVKEVYPIAVDNSLTRAVPDIYKKAEMINGWVSLDTDLKKGERVKIMMEKEEQILEVLEVKEGAFKVDFQDPALRQTQEPLPVFVYGREVNDFHTIDYDAIAMLNVSATQELARKLLKSEDRAEAMEKQNEELKVLLLQLSDKIDNMEGQLERVSVSSYSTRK